MKKKFIIAYSFRKGCGETDVQTHHSLHCWHTQHGQIRKILSGDGGPYRFFAFFSHQYISQRAIRTSLQRLGSNCYSRGVRTIFLRKPIATGDFPGEVRPPSSGSAHAQSMEEDQKVPATSQILYM